ncbi:hypothetical protein LZP69_02950 [Shewanella sp. AS1]|uniref:hypothetical protein n=1 Tax=Shewanella sp. AS1 TaxID=2907626 RepID=UPI001F23B773|nr:hypothetical protein [Shewanella sp. AS1]MCE9678154.1 hypothetical protein [Shewanella sp. AS1]
MRHLSRKKHLKHVQRSAHIRRMCYFRSLHALTLEHIPDHLTPHPPQSPFEFDSQLIEYENDKYENVEYEEEK